MASTVAPTSPSASSSDSSSVARIRTRIRALDWRLLLAAVTVLSVLYVSWHLGRGWVAHDEGTLAQSAERLLQGELPHRDFDELYTGGLTYLNAAAFKLLGTTLFSMRLVLLAVFIGFVPAVFYIASRLVRPIVAAGVTVLCVVWTLPNYPAPLPSWYNLFLAVFGVAALLRWLEDRRARWLLLAGICGGLSLLVKVVGLYFVAGCLLFLVFESQALSRAAPGAVGSEGRRWPYALFATASLLAFVAVLMLVVRQQLFAGEFLQFVLPGAAIAGLLVRNEWMEPAGGSRARFVALARLVSPFAAGVAIPVAIFLVPFVESGAVGALINGVFVLPSRRFGVASYPMLSPWSMLALLPVAVLAWYARWLAARASRYHVLAIAVALAAYLVGTGNTPLLYRAVWYAVRGLPPVLALIGVFIIARPRSADAAAPLLRSQTMLLLCVSALVTLVQFPFSAPIYFCYVAPVVALTAVALLRYAPAHATPVPVLMGVFLIAFAVLRLNTSLIFAMGIYHQPYPVTASLGLPRGGLVVPENEAATYRIAVQLLRRHARGGYTWASPDCPEVYFLAGLKNPTRSLFEFFDDERGRTARILEAIERRGVTAIVLNRTPHFSPGISMALGTELERRYPFGADVGKFHVRWR